MAQLTSQTCARPHLQNVFYVLVAKTQLTTSFPLYLFVHDAFDVPDGRPQCPPQDVPDNFDVQLSFADPELPPDGISDSRYTLLLNELHQDLLFDTRRNKVEVDFSTKTIPRCSSGGLLIKALPFVALALQ
jgi:hypothetical protein